MLLGLHALSHGLQAQLMCQPGDRPYCGGVGSRAVEAMDEGAINFESVQRQRLKVAEAGVAGAKVIDGDAYAQVAELLQLGGCASKVGDDPAFGNFQLQEFGRKAAALQGLGDFGTEVGTRQLLTGDIGEDFDRRYFSSAPSHRLAAYLLNDPITDGNDQPRSFCDRDELLGGNRAQGGVLPAQ